jgi:acetylornithine/N-succinyldiaminopimelate aminotransferase
VGLLIGLQLCEDQTKFIKKLMENKLLTIRAAENTIRILPPLNVKKQEIDLALRIIKKVCKSYK